MCHVCACYRVGKVVLGACLVIFYIDRSVEVGICLFQVVLVFVVCEWSVLWMSGAVVLIG